jgi:hypothetical protein
MTKDWNRHRVTCKKATDEARANKRIVEKMIAWITKKQSHALASIIPKDKILFIRFVGGDIPEDVFEHYEIYMMMSVAAHPDHLQVNGEIAFECLFLPADKTNSLVVKRLKDHPDDRMVLTASRKKGTTDDFTMLAAVSP